MEDHRREGDPFGDNGAASRLNGKQASRPVKHLPGSLLEATRRACDRVCLSLLPLQASLQASQPLACQGSASLATQPLWYSPSCCWGMEGSEAPAIQSQVFADSTRRHSESRSEHSHQSSAAQGCRDTAAVFTFFRGASLEVLLLQKVDDGQRAVQPHYDWPRLQSVRFAEAEVDTTRPAH